MDFWVWVQTVGAVFAGTLLAAVFGWAFVHVWKLDRQGETDWGRVPMRILLAWGLPMLFLAGVAYSLN